MIGPANTPRYFSVVERANRSIEEMAEAMRKFAQMSECQWGCARKYAAFIRNRCPTKSHPDNMTPYQIQNGKIPDLSQIRIFGTPCMSKLKDANWKINLSQEDLWELTR